MQRDIKNGCYKIGEHTEKSNHQHLDWRLGKVKWLSTMIGGSYTMALVRACNDNNIINNYNNADVTATFIFFTLHKH